MKKVMICALTLLPLIILLIMFVSGAVISLSTYIYVQEVEFVNESVTLTKTIGSELVFKELQVNVFPMQANNKEVEFWSGDESIATIDETGKVVAVDFGETYVYVKSKENETKQASCKVTVTDTKIHRLEVTNVSKGEPQKLVQGDTFALEVDFTPKEASFTDLVYESSDDSILAVGQDGTLHAMPDATGTVTITVFSKDNPDAKYEFEVYVRPDIKGISFGENQAVVSQEKVFDLPKVNVDPQNATNDAELLYTTSDETIAIVKDGKLVFKKAGEVDLIVREKGLGVESEIRRIYTSTFGYFTSVEFNQPNAEQIAYEDYVGIDASLLMAYTALPEVATDTTSSIVSLASDNESVIKIENGTLKVVGGGKATITVTVTINGNGDTVSKSKDITVTRKASELQFVKDDKPTSVLYTLSGNLNLSDMLKLLPSDNSDNVAAYSSSDESIATVTDNGAVAFNRAGAVTITVSANGGASSTLELVYITADQNPQRIEQGSTALSLTLPSSHQEQRLVLAPYINVAADSIAYEMQATSIASLDGCVLTLTDKGNFTLVIKRNGEAYSTLNITVVREVESISASFEAVWSETEKETITPDALSNKLYTSASMVSFAYALAPAGTTLSEPTITLDGTCATLDGNSVIFTNAGSVTLTLSADKEIYSVIIESTCGLFDSNVKFADDFAAVNKGETKQKADFIKTISPYKADFANVTLESLNDVATVGKDGLVAFEHGGVAQIRVSVKTTDESNAIFTNTFEITVHEEPTGLNIVGNGVVYCGEQFYTLNNFSVVPSTANYNHDITLKIIDSSDIATLDGSLLKFAKAGVATIKAETENGMSAIIKVVYAGTYATLADGDVEIGTSFVFKPSDTSKLSPNDKLTCDNPDVTIENGVIVKVNDSMKGGDTFTLEWGDNTYTFKGIVKASHVEFSYTDGQLDENKGGSGYVTALKELYISANVNADATYKDVTYSVSDESIATYIDGCLKFAKAGTVTLTATEMYGRSASITVRSTCGAFDSVIYKGAKAFDYDLNSEHKIDFTSYFNGTPSQTIASEDTIELCIDDASFIIEGLSVKLPSECKDFTLKYRCKGTEDDWKSVQITVDRKATGISVEGEADGKVTVDRAFVYIKPSALPIDATYGKDITFEIVSGDAYVESLDAETSRLEFNEANRNVEIKFTLKNGADVSCTKTVIFTTTSIIPAVSFAEETIVVPSGIWFAIDSGDPDLTVDLSSLTISSGAIDVDNVNNRCKISKPGSFELSYKYVGSDKVYKKTIIVTSRVDSITGVALVDKDNNGESVAIAIADNSKHYTASNELNISYSISGIINKDGNSVAPDYSINDSDIATIDSNGKLTFKKLGEVIVTISVEGEDYFEAYTHSLSFTVHSTMGGVSTFDFDNDSKLATDIIWDKISSVALADYLTPTAPKYGVLSAPGYSYSSSNTAIASVDNNGNVTFVGTGSVKLTIKSVTGNLHELTFYVDKYADKIDVRESKEQDSNLRSIVYTNTASYQIYTNAYSDGTIASTLNTITYTVTSGSATVDKDGKVKFNGFGKAEIKLSVEGGASTTLTIVYVEQTIISVRDDTSVITLDSGASYVLDVYVGGCEHGVDLSELVDAGLVGEPSELGVFTAGHGGTAQLKLTDSKTIKVNVNESVTKVDFNKNEDGFDKIDNGICSAKTEFDLNTILSASYSPATAYKDGSPYALVYNVSDASIATVDNGVVRFKKAGTVTITVSAGNISKVYVIESTYGLAKSITFTDKWNSNKLFYFKDGSYTLVRGTDFTVYPSDVTDDQISESVALVQNAKSNGATIFTTNGLTISFASGGAATLDLTYASPKGDTTITTTGYVQVSKSVDGIVLKDGKPGYIVTEASSIKLADYIDVKGSKYSPYIVRYSYGKDSSGNDIVTITSGGVLSALDGVVNFKTSNEPCTITISVENYYTNNCDATITIVVRRTPSTIIEVKDNDTAEKSDTIKLSGTSSVSLAPQGSASSYEYQLVDESGNEISSSDIISLSAYGDITALKGGYAYVKVTEKQSSIATASAEGFSAIRKVFVYRYATNITITAPSDVTSKSTIDLLDGANATDRIYPQDARYEKIVEFSSSDTNVASVSDKGVVTFHKAGTVTITAVVKYGDNNEATVSRTITSSNGNATSVSSTIQTSYALSNVGEKVSFTISNILPTDLTPSIKFSYSADGIIEASATKTAEGYTIIVEGKQRGTTALTIDISGYMITSTFEVWQKSEFIKITQGGSELTNASTKSAHITTLSNTFKLIASVYPLNANNTGINWTLPSGISIASDGTLTISGDTGTYTLVANSADGNSSATLVVHYVKTIGTFDILNGTTTLADNQQISLKWNVTSITLTIKTGVVGVNYASNFTVTSQNGYAYSWNESLGQLTITLPNWSDTPTFDDTITLTSSDGVSKSVSLYRSGIKSISFGESHDNELDDQFGLQQIRLTGIKSYRDGAIQNTYKLPVSVEPANLFNNIVWSSSNSSVTFSLFDGYVLIDFSSAPTSSFDEVYDDNFSNGLLSISATDNGYSLSDSEMKSYVFHLVNAVNVYDEAGYLNGGSNIVLQVDFGHDDQATQIANGTMVRLEGYNAKDTIYGNGHLMNIAYRNTNTSESSYKNYSFISFSVKNIINTEIQGANFDSSRESYHMELTNAPYIAYCEIYNMYRGVQNGNKNVRFKRCLIRSCKECAAINTTKDDDLVDDPNGTYGTYLEDMIIFDAGSRALELHSGVVYIKGFLDVYNFQNKDALKEAVGSSLLGGGVFNKLADYDKLIETANGEEWCNIVALSAKGKDRKVKYYDETTGVYREVQDYSKSAEQEGLVKVSMTYIIGFSVWSYPVASADIHWSDQYKLENGSVVINDAKMISTVSKLWRTSH